MQNKAFSPDEIIQQILARPAAPWQPPTAQQMLRYRLRTTISPDAKDVVAHLLGADTPSLLQATLAGPMTVFHAERAARVELSAQSKSVPGAIFVRDPGQGVLLLDNASRRFLHCDESQTVRTEYRQVGENVIRMVGEEPGEWAGRPVRVITFVGEGPIRVRVRVAFLTDSEFDAFREEAVRFILGCEPGRPAGCVFAPYGFPVRGESFYTLEGATVGERRISTFELEDLSQQPYDPALFSAPPGYEDMRDARSNQQQPRSAQIGSEHKTSRRAIPDSILKTRNMPAVATPNISAEPGGACRCLPGTYSALVAASLEQEFLNNLRTVANQITKRLTGFAARAGKFKIPWLAQFKDFSNGRPKGDGLFCLLREDPDLGSLGLLDKLAESDCRRDLATKAFADLGLDWTSAPGVERAVRDVYANVTIPPVDRFDRLGGEQRNFRELYLAQRLAEFSIDYPYSTNWESVFYDLLQVKIDGLEFDLDINDPAETDIHLRNGLLEKLDIGTNGEIAFKAALKGARGKATMARLPGWTYWLIVFLGPFACALVPPVCFLVPIITTVGRFFFFDFAFISADLKDIKMDGTLNFVPDPDRPDGSLVLKSKIALTMMRDVRYTSVIPDSLYFIVSLIVSIVVSHLDLVVGFVEGELAKRIDSFFKDTLSIRFPPDFWRLPATALSASARSKPNEYLHLDASYDAASVGTVAPFVTLVDPDLHAGLSERRDDFKNWLQERVTAMEYEAAEFYGGLALSQNFLNYFIHMLWRAGRYNYELSPGEARDFVDLLHRICPDCGGRGQYLKVKLCPAVSPRVVTSPFAAATGGFYLETFFDDMRLCLFFGSPDEDLCQLELKFAARAHAEIGFGAINPDTGQLDLARITDLFMDIYHDTTLTGVKVGPAEILDLKANTPYCTRGLKLADLTSLEDGIRVIVRNALSLRDRRVIPRRIGDPPTVQRYSLLPQHDVLLKLDVSRGDLYVDMGLAGPAVLLLKDDGFLLELLDCATGRSKRM